MKSILGLRARRNVVAAAAAVLALTVASVAVAGNGRYANLQLGINNAISGYLTQLTAYVNGAAFRIDNTYFGYYARALWTTNKSATASTIYASNAGGGTALHANSSGGPAINLTVGTPSTKPPMSVNSGVKVTYLNADSLDGLDQSAFLRATGNAASATRLSSAMRYVRASEQGISGAYGNVLVAPCPAGYAPVGSGYEAFAVDPVTLEEFIADLDAVYNAPIDTNGDGRIDAWAALLYHYYDDTAYLYASCAQIGAGGIVPAPAAASGSMTLSQLRERAANLKSRPPARTGR